MTATQAPTPGPLSVGQEETVAFNLCAVHGFDPDFVKTQRDFALAVIREYEVVCRPRLAPTAPVEASGSERDIRGETFLGFRVAAWRYRQADETDKLPHHYAEHWSTPGASAWGIQRLFTEDQLQQALNLRPQPSGETREAGLSVEMVARFMAAGAAEILGLKNDNVTGAGGWASANWKLFVPQAERLRTAMTTPARAEAQDEGAAGEPVAWRWRFLTDPSSEWAIRTDDRSYHESRPDIEVQPLYAHPSPPPAADGVEKLEAERDAWKRRGDNHWETLRSIREFAREGDCERIILWVTDAGSGHTESVEQTLGQATDRATAAEARADRLAMTTADIVLALRGFIVSLPDDLCERSDAFTELTEALERAALQQETQP